MNSNWSYSPETVKLGRDLCDLDLWPWPFAWTLPWSMVITPENFVMIRWWEHSQKSVTDRQTDRQTDWTIHRAAWSQLKMHLKMSEKWQPFCLGLSVLTELKGREGAIKMTFSFLLFTNARFPCISCQIVHWTYFILNIYIWWCMCQYFTQQVHHSWNDLLCKQEHNKKCKSATFLINSPYK